MGISVPNNNTQTDVPMVRRYVQYKRNWTDDWIFAQYVYPLQCAHVATPHMDTATLRYDFGPIEREDSTSSSNYTRYDLRDHYIRILTQYPGAEPSVIWTGVVVDDKEDLKASSQPLGDQYISAFGLAHLLNRKPITTAKVERLDGQPEQEAGSNTITIQSCPIFNRARARGLSVSGNRGESEGDEGVYLFSRDTDEWTYKDIIQYLIKYYTPDDGPTFLMGGQTEALEGLVASITQENKTVWQLIVELVNQKKGLALIPEIIYDEDNEDGLVLLNVASISDVALTFNDRALPANVRQTTFTMPTSEPHNHLVDDIPFRTAATNDVDVIEVQGEHVKVCASFSYADETLGDGWTPNLEEEYNTAIDGNVFEKDDYRTKDKFDGVFTRFIVPKDWNWKVGDGEGGDKTNVAVTITKDGAIDIDTVAGYYNVNRRFERELPFLTGGDYSTSPVNFDDVDAEAEPEYRKLMFMVLDEVSGPYHQDDDKWHFTERIQEAHEFAQSFGYRPLDMEMGIKISCRPSHYMAEEAFAGETAVDAEFRFTKAILTAMFETDERFRMVVDNPSGAGHEAKRSVSIRVPEAECWYIAPGTVVDIDDEGMPKRVHPDNSLIRYDAAKLSAVMAFAIAWYGVKRQAVEIPIKQIGAYVPVLSMLTAIDSVTGQDPVRTVITARVINFEQSRTTIVTGWGNADFVPDPVG